MCKRMMLAVVVVTLGGCFPTSECPLSDPDKAEIDETLIGEWERYDDVYQERITIVIRRPAAQDLPAGFLEMVAPNQRPTHFFLTKLDKSTIINLVLPYGADQPIYLFSKYEVVRNNLKFWSLQKSACTEAIAQKKIKGNTSTRAGQGRNSIAMISDTPENLRQFFINESQHIWGKEPDFVYRRVE